MGYEGLGKKSIPQLQRQVRLVAQHTSMVVFTTHARQQMKARKVLLSEAIECLRRGSINRTPEPNPAKGSLEVRMEYYVAGRNLRVVVALCDEDPELVLVTVIV